MRFLAIAFLIWVSLTTSIARADVIFDNGPPPRRYPRPRYPAVDLPVVPPVPPPVVVPVADEDWHPNVEPDTDVPPEEVGFVIAVIALAAAASYAGRDRRSERRPA